MQLVTLGGSCVVSIASADVLHQAASTLESLLANGARLTHAAHAVWSEVVRPGDVVVDATCGNGHDTLHLARLVGPAGTVLAFDVQKDALEATQSRLQQHIPPDSMPQVVMVQGCHSTLAQHMEQQQQQARLVAFNLGYLPSSSKVVRTEAGTSVAAVEAALQVLHVGGLLSVLAYTGHEGGLQEYNAVKQVLLQQAPAAWVTTELRLLNRPSAPIMLLAYRQA